MILMSGYLLDEVPFRTVYLHGLVRDAKGQKISKSLGNNIDPLEMIKKYGADALRISLIVGTGPGNDSKISEDKIKGYRNFANKLWNITRFILSQQLPEYDPNFSKWSTKDTELNTNFTALINEIKKEMNEYKFYLVAEKLYQYAWHELADVILEDTKKVMGEGSEEEKQSRAQFLMHVLDGLLRALHPFMPHVTEEIWGELPWRKDRVEKGGLLMVEGF
jgi:valyl-tRNA synthetase